MTSIDEAPDLTHGGPRWRARTAPPAVFAAPDIVVAPRATTSLEKRRRWERRYRMSLLATDAALITLTVAISAAIQLQNGAAASTTLAHAVCLGVIWLAMLAGTHTRDAALFRASAVEYRGVAHATGLAFGILALGYALADLQGMQLLLVAALPLGLGALMLGRWSWRRWLTARRATGRFTLRTLVVGDRDEVEYVISSLHPKSAAGMRVVAVTLLDVPASPLGDDAPHDELIVGEGAYPVLGARATVAAVARSIRADTIIVASRPVGDVDFVKRLGWQLEGTAAELVLCNRLADVAGPRLSFEPLDGLPLIRMRIPAYSGGQHVVKRALDVTVAALALLPIIVMLPLLALLIRLDSPGPVLFRQQRVGRDGRLFTMVKLRTMQADAEARLPDLRARNDGAGPLFKMRADPRVTRVGTVLRRLSIDELPQFWNVLIGDMSVVGPRPPLPAEVDGYEDDARRRLYIKPGITGLWQTSGRSDLSWEESVRLDLRYVENWSVLTDLQIMWRTAKAMIAPRGAY